jgi:hypothetical protein
MNQIKAQRTMSIASNQPEPVEDDCERVAPRASSLHSANPCSPAKQRYARQFGLPPDQIKYFGELTRAQVRDVQRYFSAGLVNVSNYVYAIRQDGRLVWRREKRNPLLENTEVLP